MIIDEDAYKGIVGWLASPVEAGRPERSCADGQENGQDHERSGGSHLHETLINGLQ